MRQEITFGITMSVIFLAGLSFGMLVEEPRVIFHEMVSPLEDEPADVVIEELSESVTQLVAVDSRGNGVLTDLSVRTVPGAGRVLVDVDNLLFWVDTQQSIQTAKGVAEEYLKTEVKDVDLTYTIRVNGTNVVGGPSAGAAFTAATIAALQNKTLNRDVIITGTVEEDGSIGQVGGIIAKGMAAKEGGYNRFLIPEGEKNLVEYRSEKECESFGSVNICNIEYRAVEIDVEEEIGIDVVEVSDINEAMSYLL
ncbi:MAG: hypothetical protein JSV92_04295 [archaeon]|nr:MAG: hypothetical protein JSV92_04295 [archaeon]